MSRYSGAGKIFRAWFIVDTLRDEYKRRNVAVVMIYCSYCGDPETPVVNGLIAKLWKQDIPTRVAVVDEQLLHQCHAQNGRMTNSRRAMNSYLVKVCRIMNKFDRGGWS